MTRILVLHQYYGCDTGCCGHIVEVDGRQKGDFEFAHPGYRQDIREFIEELVTEKCGADHVKDIDFDHCIVLDD